jgi:hypothetical protein
MMSSFHQVPPFTVVFKGTVGDSVTASAFYNVVVAAPGAVFLTGDVSVMPGVTFSIVSGTVTTGPHTLAIHSTDPAALAPGGNKIIGSVSRDIAPGSTGIYRFFSEHAFVLPCGADNPTTIAAMAYPNVNPPNLPLETDTSMVVKRYYTISASGSGPGFVYTLWAFAEKNAPLLVQLSSFSVAMIANTGDADQVHRRRNRGCDPQGVQYPRR